jgi:hypothetical protein
MRTKQALVPAPQHPGFLVSLAQGIDVIQGNGGLDPHLIHQAHRHSSFDNYRSAPMQVFLFSRFPIKRDEKWFLESLTVKMMAKRAIGGSYISPKNYSHIPLRNLLKNGMNSHQTKSMKVHD